MTFSNILNQKVNELTNQIEELQTTADKALQGHENNIAKAVQFVREEYEKVQESMVEMKQTGKNLEQRTEETIATNAATTEAKSNNILQLLHSMMNNNNITPVKPLKCYCI